MLSNPCPGLGARRKGGHDGAALFTRAGCRLSEKSGRNRSIFVRNGHFSLKMGRFFAAFFIGRIRQP
jgi:hypothetical protein